MTVHGYHGTKNQFDKFDFSEVGCHSGTTGAGCGLYFTTNKGEALTYGPILYTVNLTLKSAISNHDVTLKIPEVIKIIDYIAKNSVYNHFDNYDEFLTSKQKFVIIQDMIKCSLSDTEVIEGIINSGCPVEVMLQTLTYFGYTHTEDKIEPDDASMPHYIIYDLNAISIIKIENTKI